MSFIKSTLLIILISALLIVGVFSAYVAKQAKSSPPRAAIVPISTIESDDFRGYRVRPNLAIDYQFGVNQSFKIYTNAQQARTGQARRDEPAPDVIVVGDSQTFGSGIPYEDTYPALIANKLNIKTLNFGVSGYGTVSMLRHVESLIKLKPKVIVLGHYYDHATRAVSPCYPGFAFSCLSVPYVELDGAKPIAVRGPRDNTTVLSTLSEYYDYISGKGPGFSFAGDFYWTARRIIADRLQASPYFFGRRQPSLEQQSNTLKFLYQQISNIARAHQAKIIVVYIPDYFGDKVVPAPEYLKNMAHEFNIGFVDISAKLGQAMQANKEMYMVPNDGHLNNNGHRIIADELANEIKASKIF